MQILVFISDEIFEISVQWIVCEAQRTQSTTEKRNMSIYPRASLSAVLRLFTDSPKL